MKTPQLRSTQSTPRWVLLHRLRCCVAWLAGRLGGSMPARLPKAAGCRQTMLLHQHSNAPPLSPGSATLSHPPSLPSPLPLPSRCVRPQYSLNGGVVVQVTGIMQRPGAAKRPFVQTFFLAVQEKGYYVLNDIFRRAARAVPCCACCGMLVACYAVPVLCSA